jgi:5'-deoxy-5'-methylthioadenosine phosphorylase
MLDLAIIGGTGLTTLKSLEITRREVKRTPYGEPSAPMVIGNLGGKEIAFLPRHGHGHTIPPHMVNYQANIWAIHEMGIKNVIAIAAVGGIDEKLRPEQLVFPDQIIDYTWSRQHTFFEQDLMEVTHIDFTSPYCEELRIVLIEAAKKMKLNAIEKGVYGATQGPRLETAAEIDRMEKDGCSIVGMTGMPEAALARELDLCYASCTVVANHAAGRGDGSAITMDEIQLNVTNGMSQVRKLLESVIPMLP